MKSYTLGIDVGSTTAKAVLLDGDFKQIYSDYRRHNTETEATLVRLLQDAYEHLGDIELSVMITGTAGMGIAERCSLGFEQEVVASAEYVRRLYPGVRTLIDVGGEDAKIIFFRPGASPDIRMNGNCAGGTGAFIDQMAALLNVPVEKLNDLAAGSSATWPIASRCGVFAKTDIQNLISRHIPKADIAASIYRAVALQTLNSLAKGFDIGGKVIFAGGPLTFQPVLCDAFADVIGLKPDEIQDIPDPKQVPAVGAALSAASGGGERFSLSSLIELIEKGRGKAEVVEGRLDPLFTSEAEMNQWLEKKNSALCARIEPQELAPGTELFLGIDSGSTTTKIVLTDPQGRVAASYYHTNDGDPVGTVVRGLQKIGGQFAQAGAALNIGGSAVTGYGEDLIRFAFSLDEGLVETLAHFRAARFFNPEVSFVLDIGGQDMKAIFIEEGVIRNLELNEACSSGCGSFLQSFAHSLGRDIADFAQSGTASAAPCDLGTRCTVFMNSKVKQALREGAGVGDISAGLAYSVIKNCFNKVLKLTDYSRLGDHIVVQGGTFRNPSVLRAVEKVLEREVTRPDISELMGAYGSALSAMDRVKVQSDEGAATSTSFIGFDRVEEALQLESRLFRCQGCENLCQVSRIRRPGEQINFFSGNKCEKIYTNSLDASRTGKNLMEIKQRLLFDRPPLAPAGLEADKEIHGRPETGLLKIGIPRVLNFWEDYPFWHSLLTRAGFEVVLSDPSTVELAEKGSASVVSENLCFPAKLVNGHILNLIDKKPDRIFHPMVRFNKDDQTDALNNFNCPVVTGYPEVVGSAIEPEKRYGIPLDAFPVSFRDEKLLKRVCSDYLIRLYTEAGAGKPSAAFLSETFDSALEAQDQFRRELKAEAAMIISEARREKRLLILLTGRPYHADSLINHKIPEMISALGIDLITEDALPAGEIASLDETHVLTQWSFPNRAYEAAIWAGENRGVELVQMNSFGCGPDAIAVDEVKGILNSYGKNPTVVRIDEMTSGGSVKLRMRSMIESLRLRGGYFSPIVRNERKETRIFQDIDKSRKILAPVFSPFYTDFLIATFANSGYDLEILPMPDRKSTELGLKYANNDICYPATIVIGDVIKALESGEYDPQNVAIAITQTGGQCRASSYVSLLKKAMVNAGFADVPVVTVSTASKSVKPMNEQPGFYAGSLELMLNSLFGLLMGDLLAKLFYSTAVREKVKGSAQKLVDQFIAEGRRMLDYRKPGRLFALMKRAVTAFNEVEVDEKELPRVGLVGEIYVKFNPYGNGFVTDWLMERGIEPDVPPLIDFFLQKFITDPYNSEMGIEHKSKGYLVMLRAMEKMVDSFIGRTNRIMSGFRRKVSPIHPIRKVADEASKILSLVHQFGESWLLTGDIAGFIEEGINDVVCLQPFGCIANHVIAKGVEKRMKQQFPSLNLLFLDMDSGNSEVNTANRLEFLIKVAKEKFEQSQSDNDAGSDSGKGTPALRGDDLLMSAGESSRLLDEISAARTARAAAGKVKSVAGSAAGLVKGAAASAARAAAEKVKPAADAIRSAGDGEPFGAEEPGGEGFPG